MKKIALIIAAMFTMAQMSAATEDAAINTDVTSAEAPALTTPDEDNDNSLLRDRTDSEINEHWAVIFDGVYMGMGVKHNWKPINNSFEIGILNVIGLNYNSLHGQNISLGAGIHHRSYSMKRPNMLIRDNNGVVGLVPYPSENINEIKDRSSNLNMWAIQFPLIFRQRIVSKLDISLAGILNWNIFAQADNHYELNKTEYDIHYKGLKQNKVNFDFMGSLTWDEFGIYCRYSPSKFFKEGYGPEIKETWTIGLMLGL